MPINYYCGINLNQTSLEKPVIDPLATPPDVGTEVAGQMYFDNAGAGSGIMYFWNGSAWRSMDATAATGVTTLAIGNSSVNAGDANTSLVLDVATGSVTLTPKIYGGTDKVGMVPTGGGAATFLRGDGVFATPAGGGTMSSWKIGSTTGTDQDVSDAQVVDIVGGTGISGAIAGTRTVTLTLDDTAVTAGAYTYAAITVDAQGRLTAASSGAAPSTPSNATITLAGGTGLANAGGDFTLNQPGNETITFNVGAGAGILANTDDVAVDYVGANNIVLSAAAAVTPVGADTIMINDATDGDVKQALISGLPFDSYSSWTLRGQETGSVAQQVQSGNTVDFLKASAATGGLGVRYAGIITKSYNTDQIEFGLDYEDFTTAVTLGVADFLQFGKIAGGGEFNGKIQVQNLSRSKLGAPTADLPNGGFKVSGLAAGTAQTDAVNLAQLEAAVTGLIEFKGGFNAQTGVIDGGTDNLTTGAARIALQVGDYYIVTTAGSFYGSVALDIGDSVIAKLDAAAGTSDVADWTIVQGNEGVVDFTNVDGTYVSSSTVNTNARGAVTMGTIDLSASGTPSSIKFLRGDNVWEVPDYTVARTAGVGLSLNVNALDVNVDGIQSVAANNSSTTAARTYKVQVDSGDKLVVNVPWADTSSGGTVTNVAVTDGYLIDSSVANPTASANITLDVDASELTDMTQAFVTADEFFVLDVSETGKDQGKRKAAGEINLSVFNNDLPQGGVTSVAPSTAVGLRGLSATPTTGAVVVGLDIAGMVAGTVGSTTEFPGVNSTTNLRFGADDINTYLRTKNSYAATITGFGTVNHGLDSFDVMVQLYNATTYETVEACVDRTSLDIVGIAGSSFPAGNIRVLVSRIG